MSFNTMFTDFTSKTNSFSSIRISQDEVLNFFISFAYFTEKVQKILLLLLERHAVCPLREFL